MKCRSRYIEYYYIQWNWNFAKLLQFCGENKINWKEKLEGKLILYGIAPIYNQEVNLGDYLVKDYKGNITVYSEEDFEKLFEVLEN